MVVFSTLFAVLWTSYVCADVSSSCFARCGSDSEQEISSKWQEQQQPKKQAESSIILQRRNHILQRQGLSTSRGISSWYGANTARVGPNVSFWAQKICQKDGIITVASETTSMLFVLLIKTLQRTNLENVLVKSPECYSQSWTVSYYINAVDLFCTWGLSPEL